jgi:hypothetical protein
MEQRRGPVPSAQAHLPDGEAGHREAGAAPDEEHPILLEEVDAALNESADATDARGSPSIRDWRDRLTRVLETLTYARGVLTDDVSILRHRLATATPSSKEMVDDLPGALTARSWGEGWSASDAASDAAELDPGIFVRSDELLAVHAEMASVDLTSVEDVKRVLGVLEEQVAALTTRQEAVEARLQEIRAAIVRQYEEGAIPTPNRPG